MKLVVRMLGLVSQIKIACDIENEVDSKFIMILRRIPLNVRAISAKNIYQKTTHSTVIF